jgi:cell division protein FtsI/penicillin-binding protein 2
MMRRNANQRMKRVTNDNRLTTVLAVIFLLALAVIIKLGNLQINQHDYYMALAASQQQVSNKLEPARGKILIQNSRDLAGSSTYALALNKEFAQVYAVPDKVINPDETAKKMYEILDAKRIESEVEKTLQQDEFFASTSLLSLAGINDPKTKAEYRQIKKIAEIEVKKTKFVDEYLQKLRKIGDPYEPIKSKVDEDTINLLKQANLAGINYFSESYRYYPDGTVGSQMLGFLGYSGDNKVGRYGLEGFFNEELTGKFGMINAERSGTGKLIIIDGSEYKQPVNGSDLVLTINRAIEYFACNKLDEAAQKHGADGGSVIIMDPRTGAIIAMCSWPNYDPNSYNDVKEIRVYNNPAIFSAYEPGSVFKVMTMAAGLDTGKVAPETTYTDQGSVMIAGWPKPIKNSDFATFGGHGITTMTKVLESSLNTGAIFVQQKIGTDNFTQYVKNFGFGEKTGIELETESAGDIGSLTAKRVRPIEFATASFGQGIMTTPLQMVTAFAAVANGGILVKPYIVGEIIKPDGITQITQPKQVRRVMSERAAMLLTGMLVNVVENGHAKRAKVDGYYVAGKTGTAQLPTKTGYSDTETIHTFIGYAPSDDPKFVMLVRLDRPKDAPFAESTAVPLFGEIAQFALNYYQIPKER